MNFVSPIHLPYAILQDYTHRKLIPPTFLETYHILYHLLDTQQLLMENKQQKEEITTIYLMMATLLNPLSPVRGLYLIALPVIPSCEQFRYALPSSFSPTSPEAQYYSILMKLINKIVAVGNPLPINTIAYLEGLLILYQVKINDDKTTTKSFHHLIHPALRSSIIMS